jgi:hypothetical protein
MSRHASARERSAAVGRAVRRTMTAMVQGELGTLAPDRTLGERLVWELEGDDLAIVAADVATDLARDLYSASPRLSRAAIAPDFWERIEGRRADLLQAIAQCVERLRVLDERGFANEAAARLLAVLDAAAEAVREIA